MNLVQLTEPLFLYVGCLTRAAEHNTQFDVEQVRKEIISIFADIRLKAEAHPSLAYQYDRTVNLALIFYVDFMIKESDLNIAGEWVELAFDEQELAGDEQFFDLLEQTLAQNTEVALQQLTIFRECLRLGFTGCYSDDWKYIRQLHSDIDAKVFGERFELSGPLTPTAYEHTSEQDLPRRTLKQFKVARWVVVLLAIAFAGTNIFFYYYSSGQLRGTLSGISSASETKATQIINPAGAGEE
ncbi:MAG: DotU family type IV/VI secretion system protein [Candidatus Hydrogenedentes bacterium]|nr:DotU family type IV/VI secretion system protein [Candidatus Hydrogenedentota bacterium]